MPDPMGSAGSPPTAPIVNPDGSITCAGFTIPPGTTQHDDLSRLQNGDPKAAYLIVARYEGNPGISRQWPGFAASAGLGGPP